MPVPVATITVADGALLLVAGVLAGIVGTAGGITSLISYPALLATGLPALGATIANNVALATTGPGAALGSRPELAGRGPWLARWTGLSALGGACGAVLLTVTSSSTFDAVVPFLVAAGSLALLAAPHVSSLTGQRLQHSRAALFAGLLATSLYNGYFGAGAGVMTLALMLLTFEQRLPMANALKNMFVGAATAAAGITFVIIGPVRWAAVVPLGVGVFIGSTIGPKVARRLPERLLRWLVAMIGFGLAVRLWIAPG